MRVVISDTSPIRYLVLIGEAELLQKLYKRVLLPRAVLAELQRKQTPAVVRSWIDAPPHWLELIDTIPAEAGAQVSKLLDSGERAAIASALYLQADLLLIDERAGIEEARRLGLNATGTLGVLARAAERGLVDLPSAIARLQSTNFRAKPEVIDDILRNQP